jgi:hypothetical protein
MDKVIFCAPAKKCAQTQARTHSVFPVAFGNAGGNQLTLYGFVTSVDLSIFVCYFFSLFQQKYNGLRHPFQHFSTQIS